MFKRLKSGLFSPSEVINYRDDNFITTFFFFILLVLITMIPSIIIAISTDGLEYSDKTIIREAFRKEEIPYEIQNYKLVNTALIEDEYYEVDILNNLKIVFLEDTEIEIDPLSDTLYIVFTEDSVYYEQSIMKTKLFDYQDYSSLENIDFSGAQQDDMNFWSIVFSITNEQLSNYSLRSLYINLGVIFLSTVFMFLMFSSFITIIQRMLMPVEIKFGLLWKLIIYVMSPFVIGQLLDNFYSTGILTFIGSIITIVYVKRLSNALIKK